MYIANLLKLVYQNQEYLFSQVFPDFSLRHKVCSPLRPDKNPGCYFDYYNGKLLFYDWAYNKFLDIIGFTKELKNLSFWETIEYLINLLNSNNKIEYNISFTIKNNVENLNKIILRTKDFDEIDKKYWKQYYISLEELNKKNQNFSIYKVNYFYTSNIKFIPNLSYAYIYNENEIKIYTPYSNFKWISTVKKNTIFKIEEKISDIVIITKSVKDAKILNKFFDNIIIFQSEVSFPDNLEEILKDYKRIIINFDFDVVGIEMSQKLYKKIKEFNSEIIEIMYTNDTNNKDFSDLAKNKGLNEVYKRIKKYYPTKSLKYEKL